MVCNVSLKSRLTKQIGRVLLWRRCRGGTGSGRSATLSFKALTLRCGALFKLLLQGLLLLLQFFLLGLQHLGINGSAIERRAKTFQRQDEVALRY